MSNMSYCRFENTAQDLQDCVNALADIESLAKDLSFSEQRWAKKMFELSKQYIQDYAALDQIDIDIIEN